MKARITENAPSSNGGGTPTAVPALDVRGLTKRYADGTLAIDALDLSVPAGSFFGLLGPNGAGKTTLISAICNLIRISEQEPNLDRFLTVRETLVYHGGYYGLSGDAARSRADQMMEVFDLTGKADVRAPKLSGGMRRRLLRARALLRAPRLVLLDEPTAVVDVEFRKELCRYIRRVNA